MVRTTLPVCFDTTRSLSLCQSPTRSPSPAAVTPTHSQSRANCLVTFPSTRQYNLRVRASVCQRRRPSKARHVGKRPGAGKLSKTLPEPGSMRNILFDFLPASHSEDPPQAIPAGSGSGDRNTASSTSSSGNLPGMRGRTSTGVSLMPPGCVIVGKPGRLSGTNA